MSGPQIIPLAPERTGARWLQRWVRRIVCLFARHRFVPTGRHGYLLHEHRCLRCGGLYVSNVEYPPWLKMPADEQSDRIFRDRQMAEKLNPDN